MGDYLTVQDIAQRLDVTADTIRRWLRTGKLKGTPLGRAGYRIHESDFQCFMDRRYANLQQSSKRKHQQSSAPRAHSLLPTASSTLSNGDDLPALAYNAIFVRDPMSVITAWNQEAARLYGWSEQEVLGQMAYALLQTNFPVSREEIELQLIQTGHWDGELRSIGRNGQEIIVESHQILRRNAQGQPDSILEIDRDITYHKQLEETLSFLAEARVQEADRQHVRLEVEETMLQFASLVENSSDMIAMASMQGQTIYMNKAGCDLCGLTDIEEARKNPILTYAPENRHPLLKEIVWPQVQATGHWEGDLEILNSKSGELIDVRQTVFIVTHPHTHAPLCLAIVARDIHEQKEIERRKDIFISMASHELRNPLTTIHANLQLAERRIKSILQQEEEPSPDTKKTTNDALQMLDRARRQTKVMARLIGDLLESTRIQANKLNLSLAEHNIIAIMHDTVIDQLEITPHRIIQIAPLLPDTHDLIVLIDKDRIRQVISNYLANALKYSAASEEVTIGVTVDGDQIRLWVRDHGPGLTVEQQEHIWDRYYQAKDITIQSGSGSGLGLGLHICKALISRHGGQVGVDSQKGVGSTFWFQLPLANTLY